MAYSYVRRASQKDKEEMQKCVNCLNELKHETEEITGITFEASLVNTGDGYIAAINYSDGGYDSGSFVRCSKCGAIRELFDGQIEFCLECWDDWN